MTLPEMAQEVLAALAPGSGWEVGSVQEARSMIDRWLEPGPFAALVRRADR